MFRLVVVILEDVYVKRIFYYMYVKRERVSKIGVKGYVRFLVKSKKKNFRFGIYKKIGDKWNDDCGCLIMKMD